METAEKRSVNPDSPILHKPTRMIYPHEFRSQSLEADIESMLNFAKATDKDPRNFVGLCANQIGIDKSIIVMDMGATEPGKRSEVHTVIINPVIYEQSEETNEDIYEGCFTTNLPDGKYIAAFVPRSNWIVMKGFDRSGDPVEYRLEWYQARIAQHEVDHTLGIDITDNASKIHVIENTEEEVRRYRAGDYKNWPETLTKKDYDRIVANS